LHHNVLINYSTALWCFCETLYLYHVRMYEDSYRIDWCVFCVNCFHFNLILVHHLMFTKGI